jgi:hypothetical protein
MQVMRKHGKTSIAGSVSPLSVGGAGILTETKIDALP